MTDHIERSVREALSYQDAQLDQNAIARLRAVDYRPRRRRIRRLPTLGVLGTTGTAAVVALVVSLSSGAAPAFAGWQATPTTPTTSPAAAAGQSCGGVVGTPDLTDARGPYTAVIYTQGDTQYVCLSGNDIFMQTSSTSSRPVAVAAGQLQFSGGVTQDSAGDQLTVADGRTGSGVTAVSFDLSDGSTVEATVSGGYYMAWWPGTATATSAEITTASGMTGVSVPAAPAVPQCPPGAQCSAGYSQTGSGSGARSGSAQTLQMESQLEQSVKSSGSSATTPATQTTAGS